MRQGQLPLVSRTIEKTIQKPREIRKMLSQDVWLHQQLREQLWKGPASRIGVGNASDAADWYYAFSDMPAVTG